MDVAAQVDPLIAFEGGLADEGIGGAVLGRGIEADGVAVVGEAAALDRGRRAVEPQAVAAAVLEDAGIEGGQGGSVQEDEGVEPVAASLEAAVAEDGFPSGPRRKAGGRPRALRSWRRCGR